MRVHDLSPAAVEQMLRVDLATVDEEPPGPIEAFDFHDCVCGVASTVGRGPWELHTAGDELLHVLAGETHLTVHEPDGPTTRTLRAGDLAIVPQGCWHVSDAPDGVMLLFLTPRDGNQHSMEDPIV